MSFITDVYIDRILNAGTSENAEVDTFKQCIFNLIFLQNISTVMYRLDKFTLYWINFLINFTRVGCIGRFTM